MKYALIGTGKTGQAIRNLLPQADIVAVCHSRDPVTADKIAVADVGIVFVPAHALGEMMPLLTDSKIPMVVGTTGFAWPDDLDGRLKSAGVAWIVGQNFSLGLNVMRYYAQRIRRTLNVLRPEPAALGIVETHHIHKLDAPSGTALYIARALDFPPQDITSIRQGDAKGTHTVSYGWPHDKISLTHEALDRAAFAEGVVIACDHVMKLNPGLHFFENIADTMIETHS